MTELYETRLKRLKMRSMRRGIKEMDLILERFANSCLAKLPLAELDCYEGLIEEFDHDLYAWISGQAAVPTQYQAMIDKIRGEYSGRDRRL